MEPVTVHHGRMWGLLRGIRSLPAPAANQAGSPLRGPGPAPLRSSKSCAGRVWLT